MLEPTIIAFTHPLVLFDVPPKIPEQAPDDVFLYPAPINESLPDAVLVRPPPTDE
jgi:hypothetical protein